MYVGVSRLLFPSFFTTWSPHTAKPRMIVTGRGKHSTNGMCVLKPAVSKGLIGDGWDVELFEGGLLVKGRRPGAERKIDHDLF